MEFTIELEVGWGRDGSKQEAYNVCSMVVKAKEITKQQSSEVLSGFVM